MLAWSQITVFFSSFYGGRELGATLEKLGVLPEDSRDEEKRERFAVLSLMDERKSTRKAEPSFWFVGWASQHGITH